VSSETRCPTCGGPVIFEGKVEIFTGGGIQKPLRPPTHIARIYRTTAADPARVAQMEELLWSVLTDVDDDFDGFNWVRNEILEFFGRDPDTEPWPSMREVGDGAE
jgi:hypothetical protein